jgi:hypothetical protein
LPFKCNLQRDIQVWQFIVLTAGYWLGIEYYLDNKYDEEKDGPKEGKDVMPKVDLGAVHVEST